MPNRRLYEKLNLRLKNCTHFKITISPLYVDINDNCMKSTFSKTKGFREKRGIVLHAPQSLAGEMAAGCPQCCPEQLRIPWATGCATVHRRSHAAWIGIWKRKGSFADTCGPLCTPLLEDSPVVQAGRHMNSVRMVPWGAPLCTGHVIPLHGVRPVSVPMAWHPHRNVLSSLSWLLTSRAAAGAGGQAQAAVGAALFLLISVQKREFGLWSPRPHELFSRRGRLSVSKRHPSPFR